jgi:hypothetical protein
LVRRNAHPAVRDQNAEHDPVPRRQRSPTLNPCRTQDANAHHPSFHPWPIPVNRADTALIPLPRVT